jgi:chromosomal replication initiator protein
VKEVLNKLVKHNNKEEVSVEEIIKVVASRMNVKIADVKAHNKNKNLVLARQISMYLARKLTNFSYPDIGQKIGGHDHSTVIYANNKILNTIASDLNFKKMLQEIEDSVIHKM